LVVIAGIVIPLIIYAHIKIPLIFVPANIKISLIKCDEGILLHERAHQGEWNSFCTALTHDLQLLVTVEIAPSFTTLALRTHNEIPGVDYAVLVGVYAFKRLISALAGSSEVAYISLLLRLLLWLSLLLRLRLFPRVITPSIR
jgi:hypothetical protein